MTGSEVEEYKKLRRKYKAMRSRLECVEASIIAAVRYGERSRSSNTPDPVARIVDRATEIKAKIRDRMIRIAEQEIAIDAFIDSIPDGEERAILSMYIQSGYPFARIADILGYDRSTVSKRYRRFWRDRSRDGGTPFDTAQLPRL